MVDLDRANESIDSLDLQLERTKTEAAKFQQQAQALDRDLQQQFYSHQEAQRSLREEMQRMNASFENLQLEKQELLNSQQKQIQGLAEENMQQADTIQRLNREKLAQFQVLFCLSRC